MSRKIFVIIGVIVLLVIAYGWTQELGRVVLRTYYNGIWVDTTTARDLRSSINQRYIIWFVSTIVITSALAVFVSRENNVK